ncbi:hypothetical protein KQI68_05540 [Peptoniphilus sp. MSJ-1]|uniref:Uncharacterized protein n=1 Tax=Peptoniphilus ovalis TaxID=2841503 RepID=A0ABS6FH41_9FIRM|nr:DUF6710 family protein [Peptoniphilus ovalis]MBU5669304.1 hypothetical protein [Peptoniphilus ovalis]
MNGEIKLIVKCLKKILNKKLIHNNRTEEISKEEIFTQYINIINSKSGSQKAVLAKNLITIIVEYLNYYELIQTIEGNNKSLKNCQIEQIYGILSNKMCLNPIINVVENKKDIDINDIPILIDPWNKDRVINNILFFIDENTIFDWKNSNGNIQNYYIKPMNIIICRGGNHSQFAAKIKKQGITTITEIRDFSNIYQKIHFNGKNYIDNNGEIITIEYNKDEIFFYSGLIFELGRYLL